MNRRTETTAQQPKKIKQQHAPSYNFPYCPDQHHVCIVCTERTYSPQIAPTAYKTDMSNCTHADHSQPSSIHLNTIKLTCDPIPHTRPQGVYIKLYMPTSFASLIHLNTTELTCDNTPLNSLHPRKLHSEVGSRKAYNYMPVTNSNSRRPVMKADMGLVR